MTNELEKQFFNTFGIEPKELVFKTMNCACGCHDCKNCEKYKNNFSKTYPHITDSILLELMFLITDINTSFALRNIRNVTALKTAILEFFIKQYGSNQNRKILKHQVRTLFEEG